MKKLYNVKLNNKQRRQLKTLLSKGKHSARELIRARILLLADIGYGDEEIANTIDISISTVQRVRQRFFEEGLEKALKEKPRSGQPPKFTGKQKAKITAIACSTPPEGHSRWSLRLLADRIVELDIVDSISYRTVGNILKKNELKPHLKKQWCIGKITSEFLWQMEDILNIYEKPYNKEYPVICFDERPCQLLEDIIMPLSMKPGKVKKEDYHYERNGTCSILIAFEPLKGSRFVHIRNQRTKKEYALFMKELAEKHYPNAKKIILIQDNLNTHNPGSFYEISSPEKAFKLTQRFEMHYTPKKASWLNMAEIELSVISKQCLDRRISNIKLLEKEVLALAKERNLKKATVNWQFTKNNARIKFKKFYSTHHN